MLTDFSFWPPNNFGPVFAKQLAQMKNPLTILSEKFTPVTTKKESCKNINRSRSYRPLFERHV